MDRADVILTLKVAHSYWEDTLKMEKQGAMIIEVVVEPVEIEAVKEAIRILEEGGT